jgi:DNA replication protein DnaC
MNTKDILKHSFEDRLGWLLDRETITRSNRRTTTRLNKARLKINACMEDIDYKAERGIDRSLMMGFASCRWIHEHRGIILTGPTGSGKTWIACALAHKACLQGYSTIYKRVPNFLREIEASRELGTYDRLMNSLAKTDLVVLDDWGLVKLNQPQSLAILELLEDRYNLRSTIVASQIPPENMHATIKDPTIADAIIDRLINNSYKINLHAENSMRGMTAGLTEENENH